MPDVSLAGSGNEVNATACGAFTRNCAACTAQAGCGWCASTSECMALGPNGRTSTWPAAGSCPAQAWAPSAQQCTDPCAQLNTCDQCIGIVGCGWCSSICTCSSSSGTDAAAAPAGTCAQADWVVSRSLGQTCGAAKGASCSDKLVQAKATVRVLSSSSLALSATGTRCTLCGGLNCGTHGVCQQVR